MIDYKGVLSKDSYFILTYTCICKSKATLDQQTITCNNDKLIKESSISLVLLLILQSQPSF